MAGKRPSRAARTSSTATSGVIAPFIVILGNRWDSRYRTFQYAHEHFIVESAESTPIGPEGQRFRFRARLSNQAVRERSSTRASRSDASASTVLRRGFQIERDVLGELRVPARHTGSAYCGH